MTQDQLEAEILSLKAKCNNLELQLTKAKMDKCQADLASALAAELQPMRSGPTSVQQNTVTGTLMPELIQKQKHIVNFLFLNSVDAIDDGYMVDVGHGAKLQFDKKKDSVKPSDNGTVGVC